MTPAIVVVAYDRPRSLERLLSSLSRSHSPEQKVTLIISIDGGYYPEVKEIAESFQWLHGDKQVKIAEQNRGLREHILACGDLTEDFGAVVVLEDDLVVAPDFYQYASDTLAAYEVEDSVAGIAFYSPRINEVAQLPFHPARGFFDYYFMQHPCSWGQAWTRKQWRSFRSWLVDQARVDRAIQRLPVHIQRWPRSSWKKLFAAYLVDQDLLIAYPYDSYTTNCADAGVHFKISSNRFQVELSYGFPNNPRFPRPNDPVPIYDAWGELRPACFQRLYGIELPTGSVVIDLHGVKSKEGLQADWVVTSAKVEHALASYPMLLKPIEQNLTLGCSTNGSLKIGKPVTIVTWFDHWRTRLRLFEYYLGYNRSDLAMPYAVKCLLKDLLKVFLKLIGFSRRYLPLREDKL